VITPRIAAQHALGTKARPRSHASVDNGKEFYGHKQLTANVGVPVYFTHPYCSTERGSIENANGLVRYYLPKRTSFEELTQQDLDLIAERINNRPRACLGYSTPNEAHFKECSLRSQ
jgi:IS30 family transposase